MLASIQVCNVQSLKGLIEMKYRAQQSRSVQNLTVGHRVRSTYIVTRAKNTDVLRGWPPRKIVHTCSHYLLKREGFEEAPLFCMGVPAVVEQLLLGSTGPLPKRDRGLPPSRAACAEGRRLRDGVSVPGTGPPPAGRCLQHPETACHQNLKKAGSEGKRGRARSTQNVAAV